MVRSIFFFGFPISSNSNFLSMNIELGFKFHLYIYIYMCVCVYIDSTIMYNCYGIINSNTMMSGKKKCNGIYNNK